MASQSHGGDAAAESGGEHFVRFYDDEPALDGDVASFIGAGLLASGSGVIVARSGRLQSIGARLASDGHDLESLRAAGRFVDVDANEALSRFMIGGRPDPLLFESVMGGVVDAVMHGGARVRIFGEMVAVLWAEGNVEGAVLVERHWNDIIRHRPLSLYCAYPMAAVDGQLDWRPLLEVCAAHGRVLPPPRRPGGDGEAQSHVARELAERTTALRAEIERRERAEASLRARDAELAALRTQRRPSTDA